MKITIRFDEHEEGLAYRIFNGLQDLINWLRITDSYRKIWAKEDIEVHNMEDGTIVVIGDPKYEKQIMDIIENAKNGAYDI